jgi:hydroxyjasmonate sulfotransferase
MMQTKGSDEVITSQRSQQTDDLLSKLPTREGWSQPLVLYKNYWFRQQLAENIMSIENSFKSRPDDIILASNPKSGSTWLKALAFAVTSRSRYDFHNHPLLSRHPQEIVPFIEMFYPDKDLTHIETLPSPRLLSTHIPFSLLPESLVASWLSRAKRRFCVLVAL